MADKTEAEIVADLGKTVDTPTMPDRQGYPEPPQGDPDTFHNNDPIENTLQQYQLMEYFDIPLGQRHAAETLKEVSTILSWAKNQPGVNDFADALEHIRTSENQFGNTLKEQRVFKLYNHIKIQQSIRLLQQKEQALHT